MASARDGEGQSLGGAQVRSVVRALSIIDVLAAERRSLSVSDVARLTGLTHSTVHRLLGTVVEFGWVEQSKYTARYRLATGILGTASVALAHAPLLVHAKPIMADLATRFGHACYVGVLVGSRVAFLARSGGDDNTDFHPGISQPGYCTSSGKVLLAFLDITPEKHPLVVPGPLRRYATNTITNVDLLQEELRRVHAQGYAIDDREFRDDWTSIAVPIRDATRKVVAALSCGGRAPTLTVDKLRTMSGVMFDLVDQLSFTLGHSED